jgi:hypothetical protein
MVPPQSQDINELLSPTAVMFAKQIFLQGVQALRPTIRKVGFASWHWAFAMLLDARKLLDMEWKDIFSKCGSAIGLRTDEQSVYIASGTHMVDKLIFPGNGLLTILCWTSEPASARMRQLMPE